MLVLPSVTCRASKRLEPCVNSNSTLKNHSLPHHVLHANTQDMAFEIESILYLAGRVSVCVPSLSRKDNQASLVQAGTGVFHQYSRLLGANIAVQQLSSARQERRV